MIRSRQAKHLILLLLRSREIGVVHLIGRCVCVSLALVDSRNAQKGERSGAIQTKGWTACLLLCEKGKKRMRKMNISPRIRVGFDPPPAIERNAVGLLEEYEKRERAWFLRRSR